MMSRTKPELISSCRLRSPRRTRSRERWLGLALALCSSCASSHGQSRRSPAAGGGALDYYPLLSGWGWAYDIEREGATVLALYSVAEQRADMAVVKHGAETIAYVLLPDGIARREGDHLGDYILKTPVRAGLVWPLAAGTATVTEIARNVALPSGVYSDCAVVEEARLDPRRVARTTYCRDVGPVEIEMRVYDTLGQAYETVIHARLRSVQRPVPANGE
jgi:hypothetical protein